MEIESVVDRQVIAQKVRMRAKELGKAQVFDELYTAAQREIAKYEKEQKAAEKAAQKAAKLKEGKEGKTNFSLLDADGDVKSQLKCGPWEADDRGVYINTDRGEQMACPHPIYIAKVLKNAETGKFKVEIVFSVRNKVRHIFVSRKTIATASEIVKLADDGVQVNNLTAPYLVKYLSDLEALNPDLISEEISTSRLGWIDSSNEDGTPAKQFLPYNTKIVFDNEANYKSLYDAIGAKGDRSKWYKLIKEIRAKRQPEVLINLAASFASVLVEPCGTLPFIVSLWGGTGIGKSVILKICTSVWADPTEGRYITDPKATYTAMEMRLNVLNSLPMTIDDMAQVKNQFDDDFSELIYRWCSGKGKERSNKDLGLNKLTTWRNCTITNGERSLVDESTQGGAINRVIDIEASGPLFDGKSGNKTVKIIESNYGWAGDEFIYQILEIGFDEIQKIYNEMFDKIKEAAAKIGVEKEDKQIAPLALILTADYISEKYLFCDGVLIDIDQAIGYLRNKGDVSEEKNAYEYLLNTISANLFRFEDNSEANVEQWGIWKDEDTVAINSTIFENIMRKGGYQGKAFLAWARRMDLLECGESRRPKKVIKMYGKSVRAVVLKVRYEGEEDAENAVNSTSIDSLEKALPFT